MTKTILFITLLILFPSFMQAKLESGKALMKKTSYDNSFVWQSSDSMEDFVNFFATQGIGFCSDYCGEDNNCYETCVALEEVYQSTSTNQTSVAAVCSIFCGKFHVLGCFDLCIAMMNAQSTLNKVHSTIPSQLNFKPTYSEQKIEEWSWKGESVNKEEEDEKLNLNIDVKDLITEESKSKQKDNFLQMGKKHKSVIQSMLQASSKAQDSHYSNYYIDCEVTCEGDENCENMCEEANDQYLEVKWNLPDTCEDFCDTMVPIQMPVWEGERNDQEYDKCMNLCEKYNLVDLVN